VLRERAARGQQRRRLGVDLSRRRAGNLAPVIQDARHMMDATRNARCAEDQVVVLRAVEPAAQAAELPEQRLADGETVQHVHDGVQVVRRPVGLEEGLAVLASGLDLVLVRVEQVEIVVAARRVGDLRERLRMQFVVVIEERDELPCGLFGSEVGRARDAELRV
jgi:hypothetical protein